MIRHDFNLKAWSFVFKAERYGAHCEPLLNTVGIFTTQRDSGSRRHAVAPGPLDVHGLEEICPKRRSTWRWYMKLSTDV